MPIRLRSHGFIEVMSRPSNRIRPPLGGRTPAIILNSVLFPAPFGPMTPSTSPTSTVRSRRSITFSPPNARDSAARMSMFPVAPRRLGGVGLSAIFHHFRFALHRNIRRRGIIDDDEFERPLLALAPLGRRHFDFAAIGQRSRLEVDWADNRPVIRFAQRVPDRCRIVDLLAALQRIGRDLEERVTKAQAHRSLL